MLINNREMPKMAAGNDFLSAPEVAAIGGATGNPKDKAQLNQLARQVAELFAEDSVSGSRFGTLSKDLRARLLTATRAQAGKAKTSPG